MAQARGVLDAARQNYEDLRFIVKWTFLGAGSGFLAGFLGCRVVQAIAYEGRLEDLANSTPGCYVKTESGAGGFGFNTVVGCQDPAVYKEIEKKADFGGYATAGIAGGVGAVVGAVGMFGYAYNEVLKRRAEELRTRQPLLDRPGLRSIL